MMEGGARQKNSNIFELLPINFQAAKWTFLIVSFGIVLPILMALIVDLYVLLPIKSSVAETPTIYFFQVGFFFVFCFFFGFFGKGHWQSLTPFYVSYSLGLGT